MNSTATMIAAAFSFAATARGRTLAAFQGRADRLGPTVRPLEAAGRLDRVHVAARDGRGTFAARYLPAALARGAVVVAGGDADATQALTESLQAAGYAVLLLEAGRSTACGRGRQALLGGVDYLLERGHGDERIGVALASAGGAWTLLDSSAAAAQTAWSCVAGPAGIVACLHERH